MPREKRRSLASCRQEEYTESELGLRMEILHRIHKAVQGRKGDEAWAGESPVVAIGMMILERSEPWYTIH